MPVPDKQSQESYIFVTVCSECGKVKVGHDWLAPEEATAYIQTPDDSRKLKISHGMCSDCFSHALDIHKTNTH